MHNASWWGVSARLKSELYEPHIVQLKCVARLIFRKARRCLLLFSSMVSTFIKEHLSQAVEIYSFNWTVKIRWKRPQANTHATGHDWKTAETSRAWKISPRKYIASAQRQQANTFRLELSGEFIFHLFFLLSSVQLLFLFAVSMSSLSCLSLFSTQFYFFAAV